MKRVDWPVVTALIVALTVVGGIVGAIVKCDHDQCAAQRCPANSIPTLIRGTCYCTMGEAKP